MALSERHRTVLYRFAAGPKGRDQERGISPYYRTLTAVEHRQTRRRCWRLLVTCLWGDQAIRRERRPEVLRVGIDDYGLGFAVPGHDLASQLVERDLLWAADVLDAAQWAAFCHPGDLVCEVLCGDGLDQRVRYAHLVTDRQRRRDCVGELGKLGGAHDRIRNRPGFDELLLGDLGPQVATLRQLVATDDRHRDIVSNARGFRGCKQIGGRLREELHHRIVLE